MKKWIWICAVLLLAGCSGGPKPAVTFQVEDEAVRAAQAEILVRQGHYNAFKKAVGIYGGLYARRGARPTIAAPYIRTVLLLALREKKIGIDNPQTLGIAERLIRENPALSGFDPAVVLITALPVRTKGVMKDIDPDAGDKSRRDRIAAAREELGKTSGMTEFSAAVLAAWFCSFGRFSEEWRDPEPLLKTFPDSILLQYETAICGEEKADLLEDLLRREPDYAEANYHLGEAALRDRKLFQAEELLLKAFRAIPDSPQPRILLAAVYFATEEFEKGLQFYDLTLELSPEFRDALLGKAICLGYLKRYGESMEVLERILSLGYWLLGEGHYWLAWNLHELKRDSEALPHIEEAKKRLPDNPHVWSLGGTIALEAAELEKAEKDFQESLRLSPSLPEPLFGLGTIHTKRANWRSAAGFFERAGGAFEAEGTALLAVIEEVRHAALGEDRKTRLIRKRESELEHVRLSAATAYYSAAAAYFNAGLREEAVGPAEKAAAHPTLKEKAEEILRALRK